MDALSQNQMFQDLHQLQHSKLDTATLGYLLIFMFFFPPHSHHWNKILQYQTCNTIIFVLDLLEKKIYTAAYLWKAT